MLCISFVCSKHIIMNGIIIIICMSQYSSMVFRAQGRKVTRIAVEARVTE